jgi:rhamnosyl/mannosyltransferase
MKVLQIGKFYPVRGGVEKVMYDLMMGLSKRQIHCDMLCATTEDQPAGVMPLNPYARLICVKTWKKLAATMIAPSMIFKLWRIKNEYDLIHIHHPDPMACMALWLSDYKGKVVLHWHSDILKQKLLLRLYLPFQRWMVRRADLIVGTTPVYVVEAPDLQAVQPKTGFVPIGIDPVKPDNEKAKEIRKKYGNRKIIFSLGRLVEYKGYEYLIKAASHLSDEYVILIGGGGPLKAELSALITSLGVEKRVELLGFVPDKALPAYYTACDLFCLSSIFKTEAFAIVQIEAMSCGKPVISTRIPGSGVSWVNADGVSGFTVEPNSGDALAEAIKKALADEETYNGLAQGAHYRYQELFTEQKMLEACLSAYKQVLK